MLSLSCAVLLIASQSQGVLSARVLAVLPTPVRSHYHFSHSVLAGLAARGHQVTIYSPFSAPQHNNDPSHNITYVQVHTEFETVLQKNVSYELMIALMKLRFAGMALNLWGSYQKCEQFLKHSQVQELLHSQEQFQLVVTEGTRGEESMLVFGHKFSAPVVSLWTTGPAPILNFISGNSLSTAFIPDYFSYAYTDRMSFLERTKNFLSTVGILLFYQLVHIPRHQDMLRRHASHLDIPPLFQLAQNVSVTLVNAHPTLSLPQPFLPNVVPVGGVHLESVQTPLPQILASFMDSASDGVIYFSLGSVIPDHFLPAKLIQMFIKVFSKLPQKVLWKIAIKDLEGLPDNLMTAEWVPQQTILNHPSCRLFVTHGGMHSQLETLAAGVPVVAIPFGGDQPFNVRQYERLGVGLGVDLDTLSEESLSRAILTVLTDTSFKSNAERVSEVFKSQPIPPQQLSVYWLEYVLSHQGAPHLTSEATRLSWYQRYLLDVLAALLLTLITLVCGMIWACTSLLKLLTTRASHSQLSLGNKKIN